MKRQRLQTTPLVTLTETGRLSLKAKRAIDAARIHARTFDNPMFGEMYVHAVIEAANGNNAFLRYLRLLREPPVDIETFLDSSEFMGATDLKVWPVVRQAIIDINRDWWKGWKTAYNEAILMGSTASGKSEIAKVTTAYHLHLIGCMKDPQTYWSLPGATSIVWIIQAAKPHVTKKIIYMPLRKYVETMPWFQRNMRPSPLIESEMYFASHNVRVVPGGTDADSVLGEAIIGGVLDEINFMEVVTNSKKSEVTTGRMGVFDQARVTYDTVARRKRGRFLSNGPQIGVLCVASSTRYKGDFTDKRRDEINNLGIKTSYIYDRPQYEVWPQERYSGKKFTVLLANESADDIRILEDGEAAPIGLKTLDIPIEYLDDFRTDPSGALRDVAGISVGSLNPFIRQRYKVSEAVMLGRENGLESFLYKDNVVLSEEGLPVVKHGHYCPDPGKPRYVHVDLSLSGDRCGIAMVRFDGMREFRRSNGDVEILPVGVVEMAATVEPDHNHEIDIAEIRSWVKHLIINYHYPVKAISYDGWNSIESIQQWKKWNMRTGTVSVDKTSIPYKHLRDALYDGRLLLYDQPVLMQELYDLEYDEKKDKVDHPKHSSKDCADAVCGAFYTMLRRTSTWTWSSAGNYEGEETDEATQKEMNDLSQRFDVGDRFDSERPI
jgi:hypothetical protein